MTRHAGPSLKDQPLTSQQRAIQSAIGTFCLLLAAGLVCLTFAELTGTLPFRMPRSWYVVRPLWHLVTAGLFFGAVVLLRNRQEIPEVWEPAVRGRRFSSVRVYTKDDCPLCDEAKEVLYQYRRWLPAMHFIDIASDPELESSYGESIPVVEIDGTVRFRGRIDEWQLRRLIDAAPPFQKQLAAASGRQSA